MIDGIDQKNGCHDKNNGLDNQVSELLCPYFKSSRWQWFDELLGYFSIFSIGSCACHEKSCKPGNHIRAREDKTDRSFTISQFFYRKTLSRQGRFIHEKIIRLDQCPISRDDIACRQEDDITGNYIFRKDLLLFPISHHQRFDFKLLEDFLDSLIGFCFLIIIEDHAQKNHKDDDDCAFVLSSES
jgi:hypothetical protein